MTIAASFTPKPAILSFAITHELLTMRLFLDSLANNNFRMKRNLLTLVFITLVSLTAGAQAVCKSHKELPKRIDSEIVDIDPALFKTQRIQSAPVCKAMDDDSYLSKQKHLFVKGADSPYMKICIGNNLDARVLGHLTPEMLKPYAGYKIVGISFAVGSTLGNSPLRRSL